MVDGKSPDWLPPGFTEKVKYKNGRKIKYYYNVATGAKYHSKKDVLTCATADDGLLGTPETTKVDNSGLSSNKKVDAILDTTNDSPGWLPGGWTMEEKTRQSGPRKGSVYKVYTDLSSGSRFYSRAAVTRYLNTVDQPNTVTVQNKVHTLDNVDEPVRDVSPQGICMTSTGHIPEKKKKGSIKTLDNVDEPSPDMSQQGISKTNTGHVPEKKKKSNSFETVAIESSAADDLPPGWIKEIVTSKSGKKIRKDPYYTDPISGYVFRSKLDALRYLKTNDIASCACRPKKRELDDLEMIKNKVVSTVPASEQLSEQKRQLFPELNDGGENSGAKFPAESEAKILKQMQDNSNSNAETDKNPEPANEVPKRDTGVTAVDVAISSTVTDPLSEQKIAESGMEKQTDITPLKSRTSKKRKDPSLPQRASKRLAGSKPEVQPDSVLNERSLRAASKRSFGSEVDTFSGPSVIASASIPLPSDVEPAKEETLQEVESLDKVEKPPTDDPAIPDGQTGTQASENQQDDGKRPQESQLCYDFGDSWSDPLEFALKTLRGEIPIDDTLTFAGCFGEQVTIPYNQADGCLKPSQSDEPIIFQNDFGHHSESSKQQGAVNELPANPSSFSALGNISFQTCNGFNSQSSTEAVKKDSQTTFNP
ncbi:Methyl-CpG-binding domain-containing protein 13 [Sesamum alatum]|uniref:Methyl-CpG-binding domain-containing protein 13 n=1 Tax=Sesamum alatum TaxID=300844 RepID=A0AAE1Y362_9LAMI|nr:Methyl-CpG-binding domain-containing protein 13 [Sesamum alatum]